MPNVTMNDSDPCPNTTAITNISGFRAMLTIEVILSLLALVPNAFMVCIVGRARVFHWNLRLLLGHMNVILFVYSAALLTKSLIVLATLDFGDVCSLETTLYDCKLSEFPVAFPNNALTYASFGICLERVYCTIRYKHYDKNGAKPWLAAALIVITWVIVITNQLLAWVTTSKTKITPICENLLSVTRAATTGTLVPQMTLEAAIVIISLAVNLYNKHQLNSAFVNRVKMTLSARFQMDQNVQLNRIVTPSMVFEAVCYIPILLFLTILNLGYEIPMTTKIFLVHFSYIWKLTFCFLQPVVGFRENPQLNKRLKKVLSQMTGCVLSGKGRISPSAEANPVRTAIEAKNDADVYFKNLQQQWAAPAKKPGLL